MVPFCVFYIYSWWNISLCFLSVFRSVHFTQLDVSSLHFISTLIWQNTAFRLHTGLKNAITLSDWRQELLLSLIHFLTHGALWQHCWMTLLNENWTKYEALQQCQVSHQAWWYHHLHRDIPTYIPVMTYDQLEASKSWHQFPESLSLKRVVHCDLNGFVDKENSYINCRNKWIKFSNFPCTGKQQTHRFFIEFIDMKFLYVQLI